MNTSDLLEYIVNDKYAKKIFCGVKAIDEITNLKPKKPCCFIINTHKSTQPGEHWFALYVPKYGPIEYFDSFGIKPVHKQIYTFFKHNGNIYIYNHVPLQHFTSTTCGKYSLFYILLRVR